MGHFIPQEAMQRIADYAAYEHLFKSYAAAEDFLRKVTEPFAIKNPLHWKRFALFSIWEIKKGVFTFACDPRVLAAVEGNLIEDVDLKPFWQYVSCPTLLLRGEHSDVLPSEVAAEMEREDHVRCIEFPDVGHAPSLMDEEHISAIYDWLSEHSG
jgi:pimeloyl-ACP methyl ester carboxylesterase